MLTDLRIKTLRPEATRKEWPDSGGAGSVRGLYFTIQTSGARSWCVRYRFNGRAVKYTIGPYPHISLKEARQKARGVLGEVAKGNDPAAAKRAARTAVKAERDALTLGRLLEQWEALHLIHKRPNYRTAASATLRRVFAKHLDAPANGLDRAAVVRQLDELAKDGKAQMGRSAAAYGNSLFGWAMTRGSLAHNPFERVPTAPAVRRDRVLDDSELRAVWLASERLGGYPFTPFLRLLMLTGARRDEIAAARWSEIDLAAKTLTIGKERSKNGVAHLIPLSAPAFTIVGALRRIEGKADFLFTTTGHSHVSGYSRLKAAIDNLSRTSGWTVHDLRRTVATNLQKLGVRLEVTEAVLGHTSGSRAGIVGIYQQHDWAVEKRAALDAWARRLDVIVAGAQSATA
jgi:integrase